MSLNNYHVSSAFCKDQNAGTPYSKKNKIRSSLRHDRSLLVEGDNDDHACAYPDPILALRTYLIGLEN